MKLVVIPQKHHPKTPHLQNYQRKSICRHCHLLRTSMKKIIDPILPTEQLINQQKIT